MLRNKAYQASRFYKRERTPYYGSFYCFAVQVEGGMRMAFKLTFWFMLLMSQGVSAEEPPSVIPFPGSVIGNIDKSGFPEPSGIVFHPTRKTLFVVGDEGDMCEMKTDGTLLSRKHYPADTARMDFEGITVNPATGLLYIAVEGAEKIIEIDPADLP